MYWVYYVLMLVGYLGIGFQTSDPKSRIVAILLALANAVFFWR